MEKGIKKKRAADRKEHRGIMAPAIARQRVCLAPVGEARPKEVAVKNPGEGKKNPPLGSTQEGE